MSKQTEEYKKLISSYSNEEVFDEFIDRLGGDLWEGVMSKKCEREYNIAKKELYKRFYETGFFLTPPP